MTDFTAPLYIDLAGTLIETEARYAIISEWDGPHLISADATLTEWFTNGEWRPRAKLEVILSACGDRHGKELKASEDRAAGDWCATAERDARDNRADSRAWAAEAYHPAIAAVDNAALFSEMPHAGFDRGALSELAQPTRPCLTPSQTDLLARLDAQREHDARRRG